jgi:1-acyl-sn-glycerol-3-phosphate acyltransferase
MIEAKHKKIWELIIVLYSKIMLRKIFHDVRVHFPNPSSVNNTPRDNNKSVLMISNHIFFWDGFVHMLLARKFFNKKLFIMMLEEQLAKRHFLTHLGCFSVKKSSRDLINSLEYAHAKLLQPSNMVLIFPQGEIQSLYNARIKFEKGIGYILKKDPECDIWFNINLINFYSRKKPTLNIYLKQFKTHLYGDFPGNINNTRGTNRASYASEISFIENRFNEFAAECRSQESETIKGEPLI